VSDSVAQRLDQTVSRVVAAVDADRLRRDTLRIGFDHQLRCVAVIVPQHATDPFAAFDLAPDSRTSPSGKVGDDPRKHRTAVNHPHPYLERSKLLTRWLTDLE